MSNRRRGGVGTNGYQVKGSSKSSRKDEIASEKADLLSRLAEINALEAEIRAEEQGSHAPVSGKEEPAIASIAAQIRAHTEGVSGTTPRSEFPSEVWEQAEAKYLSFPARSMFSPVGHDSEADQRSWAEQNMGLLDDEPPRTLAMTAAEAMSSGIDYPTVHVVSESEQHANRVRNAVSYFASGQFGLGGEQYPREHSSTVAVSSDGRTIFQTQVWMDLTKSRRSHPRSEFANLEALLESGSDVRKTDKGGPGTKGTRAVDPLDPNSFMLLFTE